MISATITEKDLSGSREPMRIAFGESSLGTILVAITQNDVSAILLGHDRDALLSDFRDRFPSAQPSDGGTALQPVIGAVVALIETPGRTFDLPLDRRGSAFQQRVWEALREMPAGATASYRDIANRIDAASSVRAVAQAYAANTLAVAIPCHRVVRADGSLAGYRWGAARKQSLLDR
jgi:AraC family transcriptional regulator of adaptative response/methylated-DNA-[protein]-cysteine methyltransferase